MLTLTSVLDCNIVQYTILIYMKKQIILYIQFSHNIICPYAQCSSIHTYPLIIVLIVT